MLLISTEQAYAIDAATINKYKISGITLMENAGAALAGRHFAELINVILLFVAVVITVVTAVLRHVICTHWGRRLCFCFCVRRKS